MSINRDRERARLESGIASCVRRYGRRILIDGPRFDAVIEGVNPDPDTRPAFETIPQVATRHPAFTEPALRQMIARAERSREQAAA